MSKEPKNRYPRAKKTPVQEKAEQEVISALLKAGIRGENMDAVLDAVDTLVSAELWVMGARIREEIPKLFEKEGVHDLVPDLRLRRVVVLAQNRADRSRRVTMEEARSYLNLLDNGLSYRDIAYIFGRSTETVHRGVRTAEEEGAQNEDEIGDGWEEESVPNKQTA